MVNRAAEQNTVLLGGGGIGGLAAALGLAQAGYEVDLFEQATNLGEIGAGIQLGPNAFAAMDALGCGPRARARAAPQLPGPLKKKGGEIGNLPGAWPRMMPNASHNRRIFSTPKT